MIFSRLRILLRNRRTSTRTKPHTSRFRHRAVLGLERLEDRAVPATFTVKNLDNAGVDSLRWAIDQANNHADPASEIVFQAGLTGEIVLTQALDPLLKDITISGPGDEALAVRRSTNLGVMSFRIFEIALGTTCGISGLRLSNGRAFIGSGGAILNMSSLTVTDMTFSGNKADNTGGAIANIGYLTVENCYFYFNRADGNGGAIYNAQNATAELRFGVHIFVNSTGFAGGGIYNATDANMLIDEAYIYDNTARFGGGIANDGDLSVDSAEIYNNVAADNGGGLYSGGTTTVLDSYFDENSAQKGGGVYVKAGTTTLQSCSITDNTATVLGPGGSWLAGSTLNTPDCYILDEIVQDQ